MSVAGAGAPPRRTNRRESESVPRASSIRVSIVGTSETPVTSNSPMSSAVAPGSNPSRTTTVVPYSAHRRTGASPPMWYIGRVTSQRSSGTTPRRNAEATALACRFPAVSLTTFGSPVVPEVNNSSLVSSSSHVPRSKSATGVCCIHATPSHCGSSNDATGSSSAASTARGSVSAVQTSAVRSARPTCVASSSAVRRAFSGTRTRPSRPLAWTSRTNSTEVSMRTPRWSPAVSPSEASWPARRSTSSSSPS